MVNNEKLNSTLGIRTDASLVGVSVIASEAPSVIENDMKVGRIKRQNITGNGIAKMAGSGQKTMEI